MALAIEPIFELPKRYSLAKIGLEIFRQQKIKAILGYERLEQIELNNFPMPLFIDFCLGKVGKKKSGILANFVGYELNAHVVRVFRNANGVTNILPEVDISTSIGNTSIDCIATLDGKQIFSRVLPSLKEELYTPLPGIKTYENKATRKLGEKALIQVKKAKEIYPDSNNIIVCADTKVNSKMIKRLDDDGAVVIRSKLSKNDLVSQVLLVQKQIKALY